MHITGTSNLFPGHVARAYGVAPNGAARATSAVNKLASCEPGRATSAVRSLVAGHVDGPVAFEGVSVPRPAGGVHHMYTRAADKIEAATGVHVGRILDVKG
jgi:hypothetical protein